MWTKPRLAALVLLFFLVEHLLQFIFPSAAPPLTLLGVIYGSFLTGASFGFLLGAFAGLLLEPLGTGFAGMEVLLFGGAGFLSGFISTKIFRENIWIQTIFPAAVYALITWAHLLVMAEPLKGAGLNPWTQAVALSNPLAVILSGPVVFRFLK